MDEQKIKGYRTSGKSWLSLWLLYTALFLLLFGSLLYYFAAENRSLVYHADAWRQHLRAFAYYGKWLRGCVWTVIHNHSLELQPWSFGLGYGADVLTTLQYYCFGEPLASLTIFVPEQYSKLYFEFLIVFRPYLAGLSFMAYARYALSLRQGSVGWIWNPSRRDRNCSRKRCKGTSQAAILAGALCYGFCGTVLYLGMLHPFFVTPMIYLPLLLLGVERILQERRPTLFMVTVWMAALTNFYFFYMLAILTAIYGICRVLAIHLGGVKAWQESQESHQSHQSHRKRVAEYLQECIRDLLRLLGYAAVGAMTAGGILVPVLLQFRSDPRSATEFSLSLFYEPEYYQELFRNLVTFINHPLYDTELCMTIVCAAALVVLFLRRGCRQLKFAVVGCVIMICLPAAGYVMNGFSYVINRWTFGAEFLIAFVLAAVWSDVKAAHCCERNEAANGAANGNGNGAANGEASGTANKAANGVANGKLNGKVNRKVMLAEALIVAVVVISIAVNINLGYARIPAGEDGEGGQSGYASEFTDAQTPSEYMLAATHNEAAAVTSYDPELFRYTGRDLTYNAGAQLGTSSTQFFWSFANGVVSDFFELLGVAEEQNFCYTGLDDRTILETLAGVQYYTIAYDNSYEQQFVPYGFADCGTVAGDSGVPQAVKEDAEKASGDSDSGGAEAQETLDGLGSVSAVAEQSGAVLGDDSWEYVRPEYHIYHNTFALPLGYTYTRTISKEAFAAMTPTQRQESLVQGVVLGDVEEEMQEQEDNGKESDAADKAVTPYQEAEITYYEKELPYTIEVSEGVIFQNGQNGQNGQSGRDNQDGQNDQNDPSGQNDQESQDGQNNQNVRIEQNGQSDQNVQNESSVHFIVTEPGATVTIRFDGLDGAETYVELLDLEVETLSDWNEHEDRGSAAGSGTETGTGSTAEEEDTLQEVYPITFTTSRFGGDLIEKTIRYKTPVNQYYSGWSNFALNMGYNSSAPDTITICFEQAGVYHLSELKVIGQPTEAIMQDALALSVCTMQNTDLHQNAVSKATNEVTGTVTAEQDRILVFSIPYSSGWEAYDNGVKVELQKANVMYMAIPITAGTHEIRLVYHTPGGRVGGVLALAGLLLMIGIIFYDHAWIAAKNARRRCKIH